MPMCCRTMTQEDIKAVYALERAAFAKAWTLDQLRHELALDTVNQGWVLDRDGQIIGYFFASFVAGEGSLNRIAVDEKVRGQGLGRLLLDHFIHQAKELGMEDLVLEVHQKNQVALGLYQGAGFSQVGLRKGYYEDGADALVLHRKLLLEKEGKHVYTCH